MKDSAATNWLVDGGVNAQGGLHTGTDGSAAGTVPTPPMAVTWRRFKTAKFGLAPAQQLLSEELKGAICTLVAATRAAAGLRNSDRVPLFCRAGSSELRRHGQCRLLRTKIKPKHEKPTACYPSQSFTCPHCCRCPQ